MQPHKRPVNPRFRKMNCEFVGGVVVVVLKSLTSTRNRSNIQLALCKQHAAAHICAATTTTPRRAVSLRCQHFDLDGRHPERIFGKTATSADFPLWRAPSAALTCF